jgi:hypothetical protein
MRTSSLIDLTVSFYPRSLLENCINTYENPATKNNGWLIIIIWMNSSSPECMAVNNQTAAFSDRFVTR